MSQALELKINKLLLEFQDGSRAADTLINQWDRNLLNQEDIIPLQRFLIHSGLYPSLLERFSIALEKEKDFQWEHYLKILDIFSSHLDDKTKEAISEGINEQSPNLQMTYQKDSFLNSILKPEVPPLEALKKKLSDIDEEKKQETLDRIQFLKSQRLFDEEKKTLEFYSHLCPSDNITSQNLWEDYLERWANHILTHRTDSQKQQKVSDIVSKKWRQEMEEHAQPLFEQVSELAKKENKRAFDLALLFYFMDLPQKALEVLEEAPQSSSKDWLKAELLFESRLFVDLLEWLRKLELEYKEDHDIAFASSFLRAKALWELGQKSSATQLLTQILNVRPNYRYAHSLLQEWQGDLR